MSAHAVLVRGARGNADAPADGWPAGGARRAFALLCALGLAGVLSLLPTLGPELRRLVAQPGFPPVPLPLLTALSLVQPALLAAGAVAVGVRLAPRLGLRSLLADFAARRAPLRDGLARGARTAVPAGLALGAATVLLDAAFQPYLGAKWAAQPAAAWTPAALPAGLLYGGITEELTLRWGMMTLVAWLGWRMARAAPGRMPPAVAWTAIAGSALLFGLGHLPALAAAVGLTPMIALRTVLLNAMGGVVFGWLYWRRSLEAAMMAHAAVHVVFAAAHLAGG